MGVQEVKAQAADMADQLKAEVAVLDDALRASEEDIAKLQARLREALEEVLRDAGHAVLGAGNGREALEVLARARPLPGLVLLDMMMPVLDGLGFAHEMHAVPEWKDIPIVIFSASASNENVAREVGACAYLRKPVDVEVLVETVGVGQSETVVADMVDFYLVLMLAGAGDELQGIKRGILEIADMLAINKADGDNAIRAERARSEYRAALHLMRPGAEPDITTCSALENTGIERVWSSIEKRLEAQRASGELEKRRRVQQVQWMWSMIEDGLRAALHAHPGVASLGPALERDVREGRATPTLAARRILETFLPGPRS